MPRNLRDDGNMRMNLEDKAFLFEIITQLRNDGVDVFKIQPGGEISRRWVEIGGIGILHFRIRLPRMDGENLMIGFDGFMMKIDLRFKKFEIQANQRSDFDKEEAIEEYMIMVGKM